MVWEMRWKTTRYDLYISRWMQEDVDTALLLRKRKKCRGAALIMPPSSPPKVADDSWVVLSGGNSLNPGEADPGGQYCVNSVQA